MARLARVSPVGVLQHIVQSGNNHNYQVCFGGERYTAQIEELTDRRVTPGKAGRPKKIVEANSSSKCTIQDSIEDVYAI